MDEMTILYTSTVNSEIFVEIFVPAKNIFAGTYVMFKRIILPGPFQVHAWKKKTNNKKNPQKINHMFQESATKHKCHNTHTQKESSRKKKMNKK